jgi:hypothetical protein
MWWFVGSSSDPKFPTSILTTRCPWQMTSCTPSSVSDVSPSLVLASPIQKTCTSTGCTFRHYWLIQHAIVILGRGHDSDKFTKAKSDFCVLSFKSDATAVLKFLDATMYVKHENPSPRLQLWKRRTSDQIWPEERSTQSHSVFDRFYSDWQCRLGNLT